MPYDDQAALVVDCRRRWGSGAEAPRVLDVACGPGLLLKRLRASGARVAGVDLAEGLLRQGHEKHGPGFVCADMRRMPFSGSFDVACCLLHTMNYMVEDTDLAAALAAIGEALKIGGLAVIDFIAYEPRSEWNGEWTETIERDGVRIVGWHDQKADWRKMVATDSHTYTVHEGGESWEVSGVDELRITSAGEMQAFAREAGLEPLAVTGKYGIDREPGFDGGVLVARRV